MNEEDQGKSRPRDGRGKGNHDRQKLVNALAKTIPDSMTIEDAQKLEDPDMIDAFIHARQKKFRIIDRARRRLKALEKEIHQRARETRAAGRAGLVPGSSES